MPILTSLNSHSQTTHSDTCMKMQNSYWASQRMGTSEVRSQTPHPSTPTHTQSHACPLSSPLPGQWYDSLLLRPEPATQGKVVPPPPAASQPPSLPTIHGHLIGLTLCQGHPRAGQSLLTSLLLSGAGQVTGPEVTSWDWRHQKSRRPDPWAEGTADCPGPCCHGTAGTQLAVAVVSHEWRAVGQPSEEPAHCHWAQGRIRNVPPPSLQDLAPGCLWVPRRESKAASERLSKETRQHCSRMPKAFPSL